MSSLVSGNIDKLPDISDCLRIFKSVAMLDAILMPEWEFRYYSFNSKWYHNEIMASMRDGSGEHYFALFTNGGLVIKGFEKEFLKEENTNNTLYEGVPSKFDSFLVEPAFILEQSTFCLWKLSNSTKWETARNYNKNELYLLDVLVGGPEYYSQWAFSYYEREINRSAVEQIFQLKPLNGEIVKMLNPEISIDDLTEDIEEISYPIAAL